MPFSIKKIFVAHGIIKMVRVKTILDFKYFIEKINLWKSHILRMKLLIEMQAVTLKFHWVHFMYSFISRHTGINWTCVSEHSEVQLTNSLSNMCSLNERYTLSLWLTIMTGWLQFTHFGWQEDISCSLDGRYTPSL